MQGAKDHILLLGNLYIMNSFLHELLILKTDSLLMVSILLKYGFVFRTYTQKLEKPITLKIQLVLDFEYI